jgi:hypothetical protein
MAVEIITAFGQQMDANGDPMSGAKVYVYDVGTTTPKNVFSAPGLANPADLAANPIVCDSAGRHDMRYIATGAYKIVVKTSAEVTVYTRDNIDGRVPIGSGALGIANGGTGATTSGAALSNLGAAGASEVAALSAEVASLSGALASTEKTHIATGTTGQRAASPIDGDIRRNTTVPQWEGHDGADWQAFHTNAEGRASTASVKAQTDQGTYVSPDRMAYSPVAVMAYGRFAVAGGTPSLVAGYNFSGTITDNGAGDFTLNFSTALANANYTVQITPYHSGVVLARVDTGTAPTSSAVRIRITDTGGTGADPTGFYVTVHGVHA